jgi:hypothetical protein
LEHASKQLTSIDGIWNASCFYATNDNSAVVYTVRRDESGKRLEWALHKISATHSAKQLRCGWFYLPKLQNYISSQIIRITGVYIMNPSQAVITLRDNEYNATYIIHDVTVAGRNATPNNVLRNLRNNLPISLLQSDFKYPGDTCSFVYYNYADYTGPSINLDYIFHYGHIIGDIYFMKVIHNNCFLYYLVDIGAGKMLRPHADDFVPDNRFYSMAGVIFYNERKEKEEAEIILQEYGAL